MRSTERLDILLWVAAFRYPVIDPFGYELELQQFWISSVHVARFKCPI